MTAGSRAGTSYLLDPTDENRIGRGLECAIVLTDPLCSRVHAVVLQDGAAWKIRDADSRNGTFVNHQKIDDAALDEGHVVRMGSTEFTFHQAEQPPTLEHSGVSVTQTLIKNQSIAQRDMVAYRG